MKRSLGLTVLVCSLLAAGMPAATSGSAPSVPTVISAADHEGVVGPITGVNARAARGELLTRDPAAYAAAKADAVARAASPAKAAPLVGSRAPVSLVGAEGLQDPDLTPSDSTGAIGPNSYIETVNAQVGIYDRTLAPLVTADLLDWWGARVGGPTQPSVFDPQVMWDATSKRFYYAGDVVFSDTDNELAFGFSKTANPATLSASDWCQYFILYLDEFPDYPKLGDSKHFAIIGVNTFAGNSYRGSDIMAFTKPAAGAITTCPGPGALQSTFSLSVKVNGIEEWTPVPANEVDANDTGYVFTASPFVTGTTLGRFKVTKDPSTGAAVIQNSGSHITVPSYTVPTSAPQLGQDGPFDDIDTLDGRLTQAVGAIDPLRGGKFAVWTQHTIFGGAGAMVRWYEIDALNKSILQKGSVQDPSTFFFNGAISPDRVVSGKTKAFGSNMVLGFNSSSTTIFPTISMVSKRGNNPTTPIVLVKASLGNVEDFACGPSGFLTECRWGDYAAASPDPKAPTSSATGLVWLTSQWTVDGTDGGPPSWRTWNWQARP